MIHLCLFGGHGGQLSTESKVYFTMFGGCKLWWPTLAKQMIAIRQSGRTAKPAPGHFFITLFAGTEVAAPTLAQEYVDLQNALHGGQLTLDDWDRTIAGIGSASRSGSLTFFGNFDDSTLPSEDAELEDLALNRHLGYLSEEASNLLMGAIGQRGVSRGATVRQAAAVALARPA